MQQQAAFLTPFKWSCCVGQNVSLAVWGMHNTGSCQLDGHVLVACTEMRAEVAAALPSLQGLSPLVALQHMSRLLMAVAAAELQDLRLSKKHPSCLASWIQRGEPCINWSCMKIAAFGKGTYCKPLLNPAGLWVLGGSSADSKDAEWWEEIPVHFLDVSLLCSGHHLPSWSPLGLVWRWLVDPVLRGWRWDKSSLYFLAVEERIPIPLSLPYTTRYWPATLHAVCTQDEQPRRGRQAPQLPQGLFSSGYDCCFLIESKQMAWLTTYLIGFNEISQGKLVLAMLPDRRGKQERAQMKEGFFFPFVSVPRCRLEQSLVTCKIFKLFKICINAGF